MLMQVEVIHLREIYSQILKFAALLILTGSKHTHSLSYINS